MGEIAASRWVRGAVISLPSLCGGSGGFVWGVYFWACPYPLKLGFLLFVRVALCFCAHTEH